MAEGTQQTSIEEDLQRCIGQVTTRATVVVERGPVTCFANAVLEESPIYQDPGAAAAAGFSSIPAPPTFAFAMEYWGRFPELQPSDAPEGSVMGEVVGKLMASGGLMLHGEQEFLYHRPVVAGDVLVGEGKVVEAYQKEARGRTLTFLVTETDWRDNKSGEPVVTTRFNLIHRGAGGDQRG